jgi:queuine tRNA-ribosyltransferase
LFRVLARDGLHGRAGVLDLRCGSVSTPCFVPLATKGAVKGLEPRDVEALGYEMVLANTFHLFLAPGAELVEGFGGIGPFMRWGQPVISDSGGFQIFSMGHGTVADEIKGRRGQGGRAGAILEIAEDGVRFRSYLDGRERFLGPETSMEVQAALYADIALVLDECTPFHVSREYTARSTERTHRWLTRCLQWHEDHGPLDQAVYGIVQGGVYEDLRRESAATVAGSACDGIAIGGSLGQDKAQMYDVVAWTTGELERGAPGRPRHLLGIGDVDDLIAGVELGIDTFDCAIPTRLGRHGVALISAPERRWRLDLVKAPSRRDPRPIQEGCPCPACAAGFSRAYLHHLLRAGELTALRLVTLHNLSYISRLMSELRSAVHQGTLERTATALRAGTPPRWLGPPTSCTGGSGSPGP